MVRGVALLLVALVACAAPPTAAPEPTGPLAPRVAVHVVFEPPLAAPGWLVVEHESGATERLAAPRSGVELWLPVGPASLRLEQGGRVWTRPVTVGASGEQLLWVVRP